MRMAFQIFCWLCEKRAMYIVVLYGTKMTGTAVVSHFSFNQSMNSWIVSFFRSFSFGFVACLSSFSLFKSSLVRACSSVSALLTPLQHQSTRALCDLTYRATDNESAFCVDPSSFCFTWNAIKYPQQRMVLEGLDIDHKASRWIVFPQTFCSLGAQLRKQICATHLFSNL